MSSVALIRIPIGKQEPLLPTTYASSNGTATRSTDARASASRSSLVSWTVQTAASVLVGLVLGALVVWTAQFNMFGDSSLVSALYQQQHHQHPPQQQHTVHSTLATPSHPSSPSSPSFASSASSLVDSTQHCIMAMAAGYSFDSIYVFIRSLREHCTDCQVVLFVNSHTLTTNDHRHFNHFRIQLIYIDTLLPIYTTLPTETLTAHNPPVNPAHYRWELYFDYLVALLGDAAADAVFVHRKVNNPITAEMIHESRSRAYNTSNRYYNDPYARPASASGGSYPKPSVDLPNSISHVFFCDARDLKFQHDIFNFLPYNHQFEHDDYLYQSRHIPSTLPPSSNMTPTSNGLFIFTEERPLVEEGINAMWVSCAVPGVVQAGRPVLCSGTVLASVFSALFYLDSMISVMLKYNNCNLQYKGFDQGAHQICLYTQVY